MNTQHRGQSGILLIWCGVVFLAIGIGVGYVIGRQYVPEAEPEVTQEAIDAANRNKAISERARLQHEADKRRIEAEFRQTN